MWSSIDVFGGLIPNCRCGASFDLRFCAPHILPCAHTFCLMCLSKEEQRKKRKCPSCQKKYSSFILNATLAEVVERVRQRRDWMDEQARRCDECESRHSITALRRCLTCIRGIDKYLSVDCALDCVICLECCVDRHNGHELISLPVKTSFARVGPVASSILLLRTPRYTDEIASSSYCQTRECKNTRLQHQNWKNDRRKIPAAISSAEDEIMFVEESPLYYQLPTDKIPCSDVTRRLLEPMSDFSRNSITDRIACENPYEISYHKDSSASTGSISSSDTDASLYRKTSSNTTLSATMSRHQAAQCVTCSASYS